MFDLIVRFEGLSVIYSEIAREIDRLYRWRKIRDQVESLSMWQPEENNIYITQ